MEYFTDAMAAVLAHHRIAGVFGKGLDGVTDVAQARARFDLDDALPHRLVSDAAQTFGRNRCLADQEHAAVVAVPTVFDHGDIDVDDVARLQGGVIGHAMANHVIDRGAQGRRVGHMPWGLVVQRGRCGALHIDHVVMCQPVDFFGGDARLNERSQVIQHFRGQSTGHTHGVNLGA